MKRLSVTVSDAQFEALQEIATLDQTSVANVVRDCIRALLPQLLDVSRFINDSRNTPQEILAFADQMERALGMIEGAAGARIAGVAEPVRKVFKTKDSPPSCNTGAHE